MNSTDTQAELIAILKHDMNNVLTGVTTALEVMGMDECFEDPELKEDFDSINNSAKRLKSRIADMNYLHLGDRKKPLEKKELQVEGIFNLSKVEFEREGICFSWKTPQGQLSGNAQALSQALYYLGVILHTLGLSGQGTSFFSSETKEPHMELGFESSLATPQNLCELLDSLSRAEMVEEKRCFLSFHIARDIAVHFGGKLTWSQKGENLKLAISLPC